MRSLLLRLAPALIALTLGGCACPGTVSGDGGTIDAGPGATDSGTDSGTDAGVYDAGHSDAGWVRLADATTLQGNGQDHCPANNFGGYGYNFDANCNGVYRAWTSGVFDANSVDGPRFLIFGGGHSDYVGTEIYAINVRAQTMTRLTDPSPPSASCASVLADGRPNISAHTYGMVAVAPDLGQLYVWARLTGTTAGQACGAFDLWALDLASIHESCAPCTPSWTQLSPTGLPTTQVLVTAASAYDATTGKMYIWEPFDHTNSCAWSIFDPHAMTWTPIAGLSTNCTEYMSLAVDPVRHLLYTVGSGTSTDPSGNFWIDISAGSSFAVHHPPVDASCATLANTASPSLTWDSARRQVVGYPGKGGAIFVLSTDPASGNITCAAETHGTTVGVDLPEDNNVTVGAELFNKFFYNPADDDYVLSDNSDKTAWLLHRGP